MEHNDVSENRYKLYGTNVYQKFSASCFTMSYNTNSESEVQHNETVGKSRKLPVREPDIEDSDDENFNEIENEDNNAANCHTMLDEKEFDRYRPVKFAPGEGQHPVSFFKTKIVKNCPFRLFIVESVLILSLKKANLSVTLIVVNGS